MFLKWFGIILASLSFIGGIAAFVLLPSIGVFDLAFNLTLVMRIFAIVIIFILILIGILFFLVSILFEKYERNTDE